MRRIGRGPEGGKEVTPVEALKNIGPRTAGWLRAVGIFTEEDLAAVGAVGAYRRVKEVFPDAVSLNCLYALQGVLFDVPWHRLPPGVKAALLREVEDEVGE